eukprot:1192961-Prorocentrum_minimum.AAC.2
MCGFDALRGARHESSIPRVFSHDRNPVWSEVFFCTWDKLHTLRVMRESEIMIRNELSFSAHNAYSLNRMVNAKQNESNAGFSYGGSYAQFKLHKMSGRSIIGRKVRRELEEEQEDGSIVTEILNGVVSSYR